MPRYRYLLPKTLPILASHRPLWWCLSKSINIIKSINSQSLQFRNITCQNLVLLAELYNAQFSCETHLATPRYLDTPLENPELRRRNDAKYSSLVTFCISSSSFVYVSIWIIYGNGINKKGAKILSIIIQKRKRELRTTSGNYSEKKNKKCTGKFKVVPGPQYLRAARS